jgi:ParB/RepB/Spo0J family partition protein
LLDPNPHQPRAAIDEDALAELMASIADHGLLQPVTVRRIPGGRYQLIAGHRRLEAFKRLLSRDGGGAAERFGRIPAHEKFDVSDEEMALFALVENLQRDDLSPLDAALGLVRFQEAHSLSTEALSKRTGLELDRVKRLLRLARAPKVVQEACHHGILVEQLDELGQPRLLPSGNSKQERIRLDLMAGLEFAKVHAHLTKLAPKKADDRTLKALQRALAERWSFRRVQGYCRCLISGAGDTRRDAHQDTISPASGHLFLDGAEFRIRRDRLESATPEERLALLEALKLLVQELSMGLGSNIARPALGGDGGGVGASVRPASSTPLTAGPAPLLTGTGT